VYVTIVLNGFIHTVMYTYYFVSLHIKVREYCVDPWQPPRLALLTTPHSHVSPSRRFFALVDALGYLVEVCVDDEPDGAVRGDEQSGGLPHRDRLQGAPRPPLPTSTIHPLFLVPHPLPPRTLAPHPPATSPSQELPRNITMAYLYAS